MIVALPRMTASTSHDDPPMLAQVPLPAKGPLPLSRQLSDPQLLIGAEPDDHGHRPADSLLAARYGPQRIPRRILQFGLANQTWNASLMRHGRHMRSWWALNPEYEYRFITDEQAVAWLDSPSTRCSAEERRAYGSLRLGSPRADLLRMLICKYEGCVYADLDSELLRPLRELIPPDASAVAPYVWPMDWLMYEAAHPIVTSVAALQTRLILEQVELHRRKSTARCHSPHSCVMTVTGPDVYIHGLYQAKREHNCSNAIQRLKVGQCAGATDERFRRTYLCAPDVADQAGLPPLHCDSLRHWDCRTGHRVCPPNHWQRGRQGRYRPSSQYFRLDLPVG